MSKKLKLLVSIEVDIAKSNIQYMLELLKREESVIVEVVDMEVVDEQSKIND